ncbi:hypothetical protein SBD_6133 [Streptomyces bottropensis ATCC 25435]|uniref:Uncharacterized protein n=1 Tax=Streptomyces bottropensis ATCC 25435 TaxID=1054862 RepID=M3EA62_9ACTN|nr:hypothetical protein SBD_6133 [Streptomyces bottropensis ATCC 25435]
MRGPHGHRNTAPPRLRPHNSPCIRLSPPLRQCALQQAEIRADGADGRGVHAPEATSGAGTARRHGKARHRPDTALTPSDTGHVPGRCPWIAEPRLPRPAVRQTLRFRRSRSSPQGGGNASVTGALRSALTVGPWRTYLTPTRWPTRGTRCLSGRVRSGPPMSRCWRRSNPSSRPSCDSGRTRWLARSPTGA